MTYDAAAVGLQPGTGWPMYFFMLARCFWMILRTAQRTLCECTCPDSENLPAATYESTITTFSLSF